MYVIVVGAGKIGFYLTRELLAASHEVALIERDAYVSANAAEEFGSILITSDGTEPTVLGEAGVERCDILISTTGQDATNLTACQVAKYSFNVPKTMAVVTDPDHVPLFRALGVDVTISTTELILSHVEEELTGGPFVHVLPLAWSSERHRLHARAERLSGGRAARIPHQTAPGHAADRGDPQERRTQACRQRP